MPTYSYICESCGNQFDLFQKMSDPPVDRCPKCGGRVRRKIGAGAGIIFKGSGFYATDYRSPDYMSKKKSETEGSSSEAKPSRPAPSTTRESGGASKD